MEQKDIKRLIGAVIGVGALLLLILIIKPQNYIRIADNSSDEKKTLSKGCPTFIICESKNYCGTFSLGAPIIYIIKDNPVKEYYAILHTFHVNREKYGKMRCYNNEESAEADGYQPSEQAKKGIEAFEWLNKSPEERGYNPNSATNTAELLQKIDAVIGF